MGDSPAWLAVILSIVIAILGGFAWIVGQINTLRRQMDSDTKAVDERQNQYRHANNNRVAILLDTIEQRLEKRIERLENLRK